MDLEQLRAEHRELALLCERLRAAVAAEPNDTAFVSLFRWRLCRVLLLHCLVEEERLYAPLRASADPIARRSAEAATERVLPLESVFRQYVTEWPLDRMRKKWPAFQQATARVTAMIEARIALEEEELFVHAHRLFDRDAA